jgi:hypothetical protein
VSTARVNSVQEFPLHGNSLDSSHKSSTYIQIETLVKICVECNHSLAKYVKAYVILEGGIRVEDLAAGINAIELDYKTARRQIRTVISFAIAQR